MITNFLKHVVVMAFFFLLHIIFQFGSFFWIGLGMLIGIEAEQTRSYINKQDKVKGFRWWNHFLKYMRKKWIDTAADILFPVLVYWGLLIIYNVLL